ncbi:MAG: radical SAM protein [Nanoarchaeota archaeon]|nr:radical SAM protein [Nanoarchaeota archaeon]
MKTKTPGIRFIVTSACNYDCTYCHNEWEPKRGPISGLESALIKELIVSAKELGAKEVDITGGEPLLQIDRVEAILNTAKELDIWTNLTTNGYLLDKYKDRLVQAGLREMHIHIPSLDSKKYSNLMKGNSDLARVLSPLPRLSGLIEVVKANIPIMPGINDNEIPQMLDYFSNLGITPRFIESMSTASYSAKEQRVFDELIKDRLSDAKLKGSYLWGINEYSSEKGNFETLRCICFDRKCDICPETNFIHIDQDYKIRPCNLRQFRIQAEQGKTGEALKKALGFLKQQTGAPDQYKKLWGNRYIPLVLAGKTK